MESLDWDKQKKAIINRVFERGNDIEKKEIIRFYGAKTIDVLLNNKL
jgi:glutamate mutase epsilon subunit